MKLRCFINEVFKNTVYPGDDHIVRKGTYGIPNIRTEEDDLYEYYKGKSWKDVTLEDYLKNFKYPQAPVLSFLLPEAMRYYLPAFMLIILERNENAEELEDSLIFILEDGEKSLYQWPVKLTFPQKQAVCCFLKHERQYYMDNKIASTHINKALNNYWNQYGNQDNFYSF